LCAKQTFNPTIAAPQLIRRLHRATVIFLALINDPGGIMPSEYLLSLIIVFPVRQHPGRISDFTLADFGAGMSSPYFNLLGRFDDPDPLLHKADTARHRLCVLSRLHHSDNALPHFSSGKPMTDKSLNGSWA